MTIPTQHSIRSYAAAAVLLATAGFAPIQAGVVINEFQASNGATLADEDGDYEDWIELYNTGDAPVDLEGFGLSDDPEDLFRWTFPSVVVEPGEFLLVWASGKGRAVSGEPLHTSFRIGATGETLSLTHTDGFALDLVGPVRLDRDHSYGRAPDGTDDWFHFADPTPGGPNDTATYDDWLEPPAFTHEGGFYNHGFLLGLSTAYPDATILYTLDGSEPLPGNIGGTTYTYKYQYARGSSQTFGPLEEGVMETRVFGSQIPITDRTSDPNRISMITTHVESTNSTPSEPVFKGTVVRARVVRDGALPSPVITHSYFVTPEGRARYSIPVLSLAGPDEGFFGYENGIYVPGIVYDTWRENNLGSTIAAWRRPGNFRQRGREWEPEGHLEIFTPDGERALAQNVGFRIHGGASRTYPLKSIRLYARRAYDTENDLNYPFFDDVRDIYGEPVERFKRLILRSSGNDNPRSRFRDGFMQAMMRPLGIDGQGFAPVIHFINGEFWGHINARERIDRFYIHERHHVEPDDVAILSGHGGSLQEGSPQDRNDFVAMRNYAAQHNMADPDHFAHVADQMDIENFLLYMMAQIYVGNTDWPGGNIDYWRKRTPDRRPGAPHTHDGRWRWIFFDLDFGFGMYGGLGNVNHNTVAYAINHGAAAAVLLRNLLDNEGFRNRFINAFADHISTTLQPARAHEIIDAMDAVIGPYRDGEHRRRWGGMMHGDNHVGLLKDFAVQRHDRIWNHLHDTFDLMPPVPVTFDVADPDRGALQVNTVRLDRGTPGLPDPEAPFPFTADYFPGIPIEVTAVPRTGYRFAGWREFPEHEEATITASPQAGLTLTAEFEEGAAPELVSYWNFNDTERLLHSTHDATGATLTVSTGPDSEVTDGGGNGFDGANAREGDEPGRHLRINNPIGSTIELRLPTTGFADPVVSYETRRSTSGAGAQHIEYSLDGVIYEEFFDIRVHDADPVLHHLDFSAVDGASDNPSFRVRVTFSRGADGGLGGNNRFDNITVDGTPLGDAPPQAYAYGYPVENDRIETGAFLGALNVESRPWLYSYRLQTWVFVHGLDVNLTRVPGIWLYALNQSPADGAGDSGDGVVRYGYPATDDIVETGAFLGHLHVAHAPWVYSYRLSTWIYLPDPEADLAGAGGAWIYVSDPNPVEPLAVTEPEVVALGHDYAEVAWETNRPAVVRVQYGRSAEALDMATPPIAGENTEHTVVIGGLESETRYYARTVSVDDGGAVTMSDPFSFETEERDEPEVPLLWNGDFSSFGTTGLANNWNMLVAGGTEYATSEDDGYDGSAQRIEVTESPSWGIVFYQEPQLELGTTYEWTIRYRIDGDQAVSVEVSNAPHSEVVVKAGLPPTDGEWLEETVTFTWDNPEATMVRASTSAVGVFWIDRMVLEPVD